MIIMMMKRMSPARSEARRRRLIEGIIPTSHGLTMQGA
jgi:hypothetical protein